jgi:hypothetical protein
MAIKSSGPLALYNDIGRYFGVAASNVSLRNLSSRAGKGTPDAMSEFYGYGVVPPPVAPPPVFIPPPPVRPPTAPPPVRPPTVPPPVRPPVAQPPIAPPPVVPPPVRPPQAPPPVVPPPVRPPTAPPVAPPVRPPVRPPVQPPVAPPPPPVAPPPTPIVVCNQLLMSASGYAQSATACGARANTRRRSNSLGFGPSPGDTIYTDVSCSSRLRGNGLWYFELEGTSAIRINTDGTVDDQRFC